MQAGLEQLERLEVVLLATLVVEAALQQTRGEALDGAAAATPAVRDEGKLATEATQVGFARLLAVDLLRCLPRPAPPALHDARKMLQVLKNTRPCLYLSCCFNVPLRKWYIAMQKSTCEILKGKHA